MLISEYMRMPRMKSERGIILLLTLLILSGILVVTLTAADLVFAGIRMNRLAGYSGLAFFAAEAGMERALYTARQLGYVYPNQNQVDFLNCSPACALINGSSYVVKYATSTPQAGFITFTAKGMYQGAERSVESAYQVQ